MNLIEILRGPWPWYVGGVLVALMVPVLLIFGNKQFGISSSLRHICAACIPTKAEYFNYNWKDHLWNLLLVAGIALGGFIANRWLGNPADIALSGSTKEALAKLGITDFSGYLPKQIFSWEHLKSWNGILVMVVGGFMVGFGTRYSNGCTSGHSIMGLSLLSPSGLVATLGFFAGGLAMTFLIFPLIFEIHAMKHLFYLFVGVYFGIVLYKSEVSSWFRIQEMFRFDSIHMYGIIGLAVMLGALSVQVIKRFKIKATDGSEIDLKPKPLTKANFIGGVIFGMGWALTGACPGPLYALAGGGYPIMLVPLASAILGALAYGLIKDRLPHRPSKPPPIG